MQTGCCWRNLAARRVTLAYKLDVAAADERYQCKVSNLATLTYAEVYGDSMAAVVNETTPQALRLVIVTGLSGAGKTTGLQTLEDIGYFTSDNVPPSLWPDLVSQAAARGQRRLAVGIDVRTRDFLQDFPQVFAAFCQQHPDITPEIVFLDADDAVLLQRYNFTRRKHPLGHVPLAATIVQERQTLGELRAVADYLLDTSELSSKQLSERLRQRYAEAPYFQLRLMSFGFKNGAPIDADNVFDVRSLPNPYYDPALRPLDGRDEPVRRYVFSPEGENFYQSLQAMVRRLVAAAQTSGRLTYTIAIGCTGGQHRSVAIAEALCGDMQTQLPQASQAQSVHRDLEAALQQAQQAVSAEARGG